MANVSSQSTWTSGSAQIYAKKGAVAISAINASVPLFEHRLAGIRTAHGKDGVRPKTLLDEHGRHVRDADGNRIVAREANGNTIYEAKYVQAYSLVESFGHDELDPTDPESWTKAQQYGWALAEDRFPGHPALIATEVNGRSGCVHNHLIVGAVHPESGKQLDSNVVTHSRLAVAHDRVLTEQGFEQRADMRAKTAAAEQAMADARDTVLADPGNQDLSPSQLQRKITSAENTVRLKGDDQQSVAQTREDRRLREFDRYQLNEQDRQIARDIGTEPPKEKFSEIELESRARAALSDPRFRSWDELADVAREHRVTVTARGQDVSYGMMLAQPDGAVGLGDGFRREDVDAAIARNVREHEQQAAEEAAAEGQEIREPSAQQAETQATGETSSPQQLESQRRVDQVLARRAERIEELTAQAEGTRNEVEAHFRQRREGLDAETAERQRKQQEYLDDPPARFAGLTADELAREVDEKVVVREVMAGRDFMRTDDLTAMRDRHGLSRDEAEYLATKWWALDRPVTAQEDGYDLITEQPTQEATTAESQGRQMPAEPEEQEYDSDQQIVAPEVQTSSTAPALDEPAPASASAPAAAIGEPEVQDEPSVDGDRIQVEEGRSGLRDVRATTPSMQNRYDRLAGFEEHWHGRLPSTPEDRIEFERQVKEIGVGPTVLDGTEAHMDPAVREQLQMRVKKKQESSSWYESTNEARREREQITMSVAERQRAGELDRRIDKGDWMSKQIRSEIDAGDYAPVPQDQREQAFQEYRLEKSKAEVSSRVADSDGHKPESAAPTQPTAPTQQPAKKPSTEAQQRLLDRKNRQRKENRQIQERQEQQEDEGMEMEM